MSHHPRACRGRLRRSWARCAARRADPPGGRYAGGHAQPAAGRVGVLPSLRTPLGPAGHRRAGGVRFPAGCGDGQRGSVSEMVSRRCVACHVFLSTRVTGDTCDRCQVEDGLPVRFWAMVDRSGECWLWTGSLDRAGYGFDSVNGRTVRAHRRAYLALVGEIPEGRQLDHLCRTPRCVNPAHLEPVTAQEDTLRGEGPAAINARRTKCVNGHEFSPENTYQRPAGRWRGRGCLTCARERRAAKT